ncbi:MAG: tetratricopeptide repeat protein [Candidatus Zixiibacteriota bacterium]
MSQCSDKQIGGLLHLYELNLLSDDDRDRVERHLLDCDNCFNEYMEFRNASGIMRKSDRFWQTLSDLAESQNQGIREQAVPDQDRQPGKRPALAFSLLLVTAAVIILLVLKPWHIEIGPSKDARAVENRIAVAFFENLVDPSDSDLTAEMFTNLLITDLSISDNFHTVSAERLRDIRNELSQDQTIHTSTTMFREIAEWTNAKWLLTGNILQTKPYLVASCQLIEYPSGQTITSHRISGSNLLDIYGIVDSMATLTRRDLFPSESASQFTDRHVTELTTNSLLAYRYYLEGIEYLDKYYIEEAKASFRQAIIIDTGLAMAYFYLADLEDSGFIDKAVQYSENISERDRALIRAKYSLKHYDFTSAIAELQHLIDRDPEDKFAMEYLGAIYSDRGDKRKSLHWLERINRLDPLDKICYNQMAYLFRDLDLPDSSIWAINKYIDLAPNESNPYDSRGDLYASNGKIHEAIASYRQALDIKPDFFASLEKYGHMHIFLEEFAVADSCYRLLENWSDPIVQTRGYNHEIYIPLYQGKFERALQLVEQSKRFDANAHLFRIHSHSLQLQSLILLETGREDSALTIMRQAIENVEEYRPDDKTIYRDVFIQVLAQNGRIDEAQERAAKLKNDLAASHQSLAKFWYAAAVIAHCRGLDDSARLYVDAYLNEFDIDPNLHRKYFAAKILLDNNRLADAVREFEKITRRCGSIELYFGIYHTLSFYFLGRAYEESNWTDRAVEQYRIFVEKWRDSDYTRPELIDAKQRITRLTKTP